MPNYYYEEYRYFIIPICILYNRITGLLRVCRQRLLRFGHIASTKAVALPGNVGFEEDYQNASFVRVRNITLGYNLSGKKLGRVGDYVSSIRVFVDCQNPFTFTKFVGVDPEIKTGGDGSKAEYPMTRTYSFGAKICF